ncbi:MAG: translation initiation factor IF-2 [SAR202 cluster bacterium]|nr:translation initiation factor IF-2 [SAR202 cluster bacterium]|tara:strand:+ start:1825 stop:3618 length:1794 start_codon:yes stop_codon:yes gene_type:complete
MVQDSNEIIKSSDTKSPVELPSNVSVGELANILEISNVDVIKSLMRLGVMATVNETVEFDVAAKVAASFEIGVLKPKEKEESLAAKKTGIDSDLSDENALPRPPIVTILGHVDHGKTTLLDYIRGTKVVDSEAGGITQGIGAYQVEKSNSKITFIDTPGHAAFTQMRANGAQVTDIAIIVVAADDGVMPQTIEAIDHARAANVPLIIAMNKIDLEGSDVDKVYGQLAEHEVIVESYGGDTIAVPISALKGDGVDDLLENILLLSEIQELKANPNRLGIGVVIESKMDRQKGPVATILVRSGSVKNGDIIVAGNLRGKIKSMIDGFGRNIDLALPSTPIEILGLNGLPNSGDQFDVMKSEKDAKELLQTRERLSSQKKMNKSATTMDEVMRRVKQSGEHELSVIIKTGNSGSIDAVSRAVQQIFIEDVEIKIIHCSSGAITESDILLATASNAIILGFETNVESGARKKGAVENVTIRTYDIIYNLIDDVANSAKNLLEPEKISVVLGHANILEVFSRGKREKIAGVRVIDGLMKRSGRMRILRSGEEIFDGAITSMKHLKENVNELANNFEGGIMIDGFHDYEIGDVLEAYEIRQNK